MSDIIEILRKGAGPKDVDRAADEITRLRADLAAANTRMSKLDFERTAAELERDGLRAENEKLREAVKAGVRFVGASDDAMEELRKENARLREALEFYGWAEHWVKQPYQRSVIEEDKGRRARAALEGVTKKEGAGNE